MKDTIETKKNNLNNLDYVHTIFSWSVFLA